jgi:hypothetical protein
MYDRNMYVSFLLILSFNFQEFYIHIQKIKSDKNAGCSSLKNVFSLLTKEENSNCMIGTLILHL